jgi:hypothetical protein
MMILWTNEPLIKREMLDRVRRPWTSELCELVRREAWSDAVD